MQQHMALSSTLSCDASTMIHTYHGGPQPYVRTVVVGIARANPAEQADSVAAGAGQLSATIAAVHAPNAAQQTHKCTQ